MAPLQQGANTRGLNPHAPYMVFINFFLSLCNKDHFRYLRLAIFLCKINIFVLNSLLVNMPAILSTLSNSAQLRHRRTSFIQASEQLLRPQALIPSYQQQYYQSLGPRDALCDVFNHPALRCLVHAVIENEIYVRAFQETDYCYAGITIRGRQHIPSYQIKPDIARQLWNGIVTLARILARMAICTANNCIWKDVPVDEYNSPIFPWDVLIEWGSNRLFTIPHLLLASETDVDNPLLQYQTRSLSKLQRYFTNYQNVVIYYANWTRNAVRSSINHGFLSETNWGAVWGFRKDEFLSMVAPGVFDLTRAREEGRVRRATHSHYAAIFEHKEAARLVAQLVACLLNRQGVPLGEDFAKSPFLEGLETSTAPETLTADESIPAESEGPVESASGSVGGGEEEESTQVGS